MTNKVRNFENSKTNFEAKQTFVEKRKNQLIFYNCKIMIEARVLIENVLTGKLFTDEVANLNKIEIR